HFWGGEAADTAQADAVIERQLDKGVDLIKVMATGGQLTKGSDPGAAQFDLATLTHIVQRAAAHDKLVAAHCHGTQGIHFAAAAGVSTIEHCSWAGKAGWAADYRPETAALIAERGTWISPTVNRGWQRYLEGRNQQMRERIQGNFAAMRAKEIPFIASTDAGIPGVYHHHLPLALPVFAQIAGLSAEAVLRSATSQAALAIGLHSVTGRIENGLSADLLLVQGNPLIDLSALADPAQVWFRGRPVKSI
ncbi:MAG: amidohydrolase family protein, partial [Pseudomonadales bacterium]|nr:amidohydrolase family protein [Pseudomonadales bacterium]